MIRKLKINHIKWIDVVGASEGEKLEILNKYSFHELDVEACLEPNQRPRIDEYPEDGYSFITYHFPKFDLAKKVYVLNEFNIFFSKDYIITFRDHSFSQIDQIFNHYDGLKQTQKDKEIKFTSGYILYEITQAMLEKMFGVLKKSSMDIKNLENSVFDKADSFLVKDIMLKKRNIAVLRNMFTPQVTTLQNIERVINKIYDWEMEVYFEDLEDKLDQIINDIKILWEQIDNVEDAFKSIIDIRTNNTVKLLTLFSAFLLPLTLITSFYGMNITLPYQESPLFIYFLITISVLVMFVLYAVLKRSGKF